MTEVFFRILEISITAGIVALIVMVFRLIFKGVPRWVSCLLWALVAIRILCPFTIESEFSLMPDLSGIGKSYVSQAETVPESRPLTQSDISTQEIQVPLSSEEQASPDAGRILAVVWVCGMAGMLLYGGVSYLLTRRKVCDSVPYKDNIRQSEKVNSPFILGLVRPFIYIPFSLDKKTRRYVLAHEQAHLKRLDHIWKPLGFVLLCIHWFNPLMWVSYILLCRDVEVACDEKVIRDYDLNKRKDYARALLDCKVSYGMPSACPLSFGEVGVGERIRKTLRYKKPAKIFAVVALVMILSVSLCLLTDPVSQASTGYFTGSDRVTKGYEKPTVQVDVLPETQPSQVATETEAPADTQAETTAPQSKVEVSGNTHNSSTDYQEESLPVVLPPLSQKTTNKNYLSEKVFGDSYHSYYVDETEQSATSEKEETVNNNIPVRAENSASGNREFCNNSFGVNNGTILYNPQIAEGESTSPAPDENQ